MPPKQKTAHLQRATPTDTTTSQTSEETEEMEAETEATTSYAMSKTELSRTIANPRAASPQAILGLQRHYGNQAVQRMIQRSQGHLQPTIQRVGATAQAPEQSELMSYLTDLSLIPYFQKFCETELSLENFLAFHAIRHYKKDPTLNEATRIYEEYIQKGAPKEGNFPGTVYNEVSEAIGSDEFKANAATIFDKVEYTLMSGLSDTFQRFKESKDYKESKSPKAKLLAPINAIKGLKLKREGHMNKRPKGYKGEANI